MAGENAFGTRLERFGTGDVFTAIGNITSLSGPGLSRATIDVTDHDSPDAWQEFLGGLKNGGQITATINRRPGVHDALVADFEDDEPRSYRMGKTGGPWWTFDAILTGYQPDNPHDNKKTASLTWQVTGKPTIGAS